MRRMLADHGRVSVLAASVQSAEVHRRALAQVGIGLGVDVVRPTAWIEGLWGLVGDGRRIVAGMERELVMAGVVAGLAPEDLEPLRANPGTVRLLARIVRELAPQAFADVALEAPAERVVREVARVYTDRLAALGLIEPAEAAEALAEAVAAHPVAQTSSVVVRDVDRLPAHLIRLLAAAGAAGEVQVVLTGEHGRMADELARAFEHAGAAVSRAAAAGGAGRDDGGRISFLEVAGPHAKVAALTAELERLLAPTSVADDARADRRALVVSPRPAELLDELAEPLASCGIAASATSFVRFSETFVGSQLAALLDLVDRMRTAGEDRLAASGWWPAPELSDWLACPLSGVDAALARGFDKKIRSRRSLTPEGVLRELQSVQGRQRAAAKRAARAGSVAVPAVCADVVQFLWQDRPVSALKAMLSVIEVAPAAAFGSADGVARQAVEAAMARRAIEVVGTMAHGLGVSQQVALGVLDGVCVAAPLATAPATTRSRVDIMTLADAALAPRDAYDAVLFADMDVQSYPLGREEGPLVSLAEDLDRTAVVLERIAQQRAQHRAASAAATGPVVLARVTHDRQAKDRYPAALWTELAAQVEAARGAVPLRQVGEGDVVLDLDPALARGMVRTRVACLPPQRLSPAAVPHLVLKAADPEDPGTLVPRPFSASQIESYAACPLCWFISSRVRPQTLDAGFSNMEKGNFVHDVLHHFHERLQAGGVARVTRENLAASLELLREVFHAVEREHAQGKTASSGALVALSRIEQAQLDDILPQLEGVVRLEAAALAPFAPAYLEYSFNELGVTYAGWPLGGRIDRVDVDAEGRAVVIDYKHRAAASPFKLTDPTVPDRKTGEVPAEDSRWLPAHTQTLIYAQALHRALGLDVRAALYLTTKGKRPAFMGAASDELVEEEPGDGRIPGLHEGFPSRAGGAMDFDALLDRVEAAIADRLAELAAGDIQAAMEPAGSCTYNHPFGFTRRDA